MIGKASLCLLVLSLLTLGALPASAQIDPTNRISNLSRVEPDPPELRLPLPIHGPRPPVYPTPDFSGMAHAAGIIFSGTVKRIDRHSVTNGQAIETVAVTFRVDSALRGAWKGQDLTIMQWVGLWSSGQRYRVGEKVLLFLYPRSKLGLTSWVGGPLGRFAVNASGYVLPTMEQYSAFRTDPVLGGKSRLHISDFALAVLRAGGKE